jgi:hypothetical protein
MRESAEYFMAGFFGINWFSNPQIKLELIIEQTGFNNSLVAGDSCNNSNVAAGNPGTVAQYQWYSTYLQNATDQFKPLVHGYNWTVNDTFAAQGLCPYETVGLGYSQFCSLFNYEEWQGYEYALDLQFAGNAMFQCPVGRAVGVGYVQELVAVCDCSPDEANSN